MSVVIITVSIVAAIAIAEGVLASKWNRFYFTVGLPVFARRIEREEVFGKYIPIMRRRDPPRSGGGRG